MSDKNFNDLKKPVSQKLSKSALQSEYVRSYAKLYGYDIDFNKEVSTEDIKHTKPAEISQKVIIKEDEVKAFKVVAVEEKKEKNRLKDFALILGMIFSVVSYLICLFVFLVLGLNGFKDVAPIYYDLFGKIGFLDKNNLLLILTIVIIGFILLLNTIYFIKSVKAIKSNRTYKFVFLKTLNIMFSILLFLFTYAISMMERIKFTEIILSSQKIALIAMINMITTVVSSYFTFLYSFSINAKRTQSVKIKAVSK